MNYEYFDFPYYQKSSQFSPLQSDSIEDAECIIFIKKEDNTEDRIELMKKILKAIGLEIEKNAVGYLVEKNTQYRISEYLPATRKMKILIFGMPAKNFNLQITTIPYKIIELNKHQFLFAHSLEELTSNTDYKRQLWEQLQNLFND